MLLLSYGEWSMKEMLSSVSDVSCWSTLEMVIVVTSRDHTGSRKVRDLRDEYERESACSCASVPEKDVSLSASASNELS